ncbi:hypothetical protein PR202_gb14293 [Eleusine coracana subsp. coracana]|uniref:Late embryogenesis abundant protein LEA-2 subgroup domain-containing protein n=1 Tax=Eleusine coracana subsp. coracana TaxID=191504 RepID=A0AAV5EV06_ELECO|nr:hypothetical protein QOZ80_4BG0333960 [Eleusine coracana subsp. coracana]GJN26367.1 hypothetical protein PR202_gb14293 [Eleusine coracana subsp. coracana]
MPAPAATTATSNTGFITGRIRRPVQAERPHLTRCTKLLCSAFLGVLFVVGVTIFVVYLAVRPHRPRFHVTALSAAGLQQSGGVTLSGQLSIRNPNHDVAFLFDRLYLSVVYRDAEVVRDADLTGGPLYQTPKTTTPVPFQGLTVGGADAGQAMARDAAAASGGGTVAMTVKVRSRIKARLAFWGNRHWHPLHVSCDVAVGPDGQLLPEYQQKRCSIDFF